tara:strand:- start:423 stop:527 length:105 start_codon:yes stop_codon:yes gene_type:complete
MLKSIWFFNLEIISDGKSIKKLGLAPSSFYDKEA